MKYALSLHYKQKHEKVWVYVPDQLHPWGGSCPAWQLSCVAVVLCGRCPKWQLSWVAIVLGGNLPMWQLSGWQLYHNVLCMHRASLFHMLHNF